MGSKITGPDRLDRWALEDPMQHRALLLMAMQGEGIEPRGMFGRSLTCTAKAIGRSLSTVRDWTRKRRWEQRIAAHEDRVAYTALKLYRALYMEDYGRSELPHIQHLVSETLLESKPDAAVPDRTSTDVQAEAERLLSKLIAPEPPPDVQEKVQGAVDAHREKLLQNNKALQGLARKTLLEFKRQLEKKLIKVRISDLERIHALLGKLEEEETRLVNPGLPVAGVDNAIVDSVRVKLAKATGGSELEAIHEDLREALMIADQMMASDDQRQVELKLLEGGVAEDNGATG